MKHIGLAVGATVATLSVGCAFLGLNPIPLPTPAPTATPSPAPTATPAPTPTPVGATPAPTPDPAKVAAGKTVYEANCQLCHNADAKGQGKNLRGVSEASLTEKMATRGSMGTPTAWSSLSTEEKGNLASYLGSLTP